MHTNVCDILADCAGVSASAPYVLKKVAFTFGSNITRI